MRLVILDLDGVLRRWDPAIMARAEHEALMPPGTLAEAVLGNRALLRDAVTGALTDEEWRDEIAYRLSQRFGTAAAAVAVAAWSEPAGEVDHEMLALVRRLRASVPVALFSNATTRLPRDLDTLGLVEEVDTVINSSDLGLAKPDIKAFEAAATWSGRHPGECLMWTTRPPTWPVPARPAWTHSTTRAPPPWART